jgi:hypothetical protein
MVNRPGNSSYCSPDPKMSTAERRTPHRKPIFAKPLINNYLREIGEIGLDKRSRVHPLPVGNFPLGRRVGFPDKCPLAQLLPTGQCAHRGRGRSGRPTSKKEPVTASTTSAYFSPGSNTSLAVLPLENLSGDPDLAKKCLRPEIFLS